MRPAWSRSAELTERLEELQKIVEVLSLLEYEAASQISILVEVLLDPSPSSAKLQAINVKTLRESLERKDRKLEELVRAIGEACRV